jgi:KaiC/GvpD/RAD55 family RecA-like ATPase
LRNGRAIGSGKTTFGVEFIYRGASEFNEPGIIALFEVAPVIRDALGFMRDLRELEQAGRLRIVFTSPLLGSLRATARRPMRPSAAR